MKISLSFFEELLKVIFFLFNCGFYVVVMGKMGYEFCVDFGDNFNLFIRRILFVRKKMKVVYILLIVG